MEETFYDRLKKEQLDLQEKIAKLGDFLVSDKFVEISKIQQSLLLVQFSAMKSYNDCLIERLKYIDKD